MNLSFLSPTREPFIGYVASVLVALFASSWLGGLLISQVGVLSGSDMAEAWKINVTAGIFLGIVAANPIDVIAGKIPSSQMPFRLIMGFAAGVFVQAFFITPFTGHGMSNFLLLLLAGLGIPAGILFRWAEAKLASRNLDPVGRLADMVFRFLNWSDRLMFIFLMAVSFFIFTSLQIAVWQVLAVLAVMLFLLVTSISGWDAECEAPEDLVARDHQAWLEIDPELPAVDRKREGVARLKSIILQLFPGAIMFGAMMHLAMHIVLVTLPAWGVGFSPAEKTIQSISVLSFTGLVVFLIFIIGALIFSLLALWAVGLSQRWTNNHLREKSLHVIRFMHFRPMERYWAAARSPN